MKWTARKLGIDNSIMPQELSKNKVESIDIDWVR